MVSRTARFVQIALCSGLLLAGSAFAKELSDYRVGDTVEADIVAPQKFLVVDTQSADPQKRRQIQNLPMVARFYPAVADETDAALRGAFTNAHNNFFSLVLAQFHRQLPDPKVTDDFLQQVLKTPGLDKSFPLTVELAGIWARGQSDEDFINSLAGRLHESMQLYIFPAQVPDGWKTGNGARLVSLPNADALPTADMVEEKGFTVLRSNIVSLTKARTDFRAEFTAEDRAWANFAVEFIKENCAPDMKLTDAVRLLRATKIQMGDTYQAGQVVAKRGDVITAKMLAAIEKVDELTPKPVPVPAPIAAPAVVETAKPVVATAPPVADAGVHWLWFALGGVSIVAVMAVGALWHLRRKPALSLLPAERAGGTVLDVSGTGSGKDYREMLAPHLAKLLTNKFVRKLMAERADLLLVQQQVATEIAELEQRLEQIHAPLQERLKAYETRIAELEKQLAEQAEQNRALIKAKIEGVKQQMERERSQSRLKFN